MRRQETGKEREGGRKGKGMNRREDSKGLRDEKEGEGKDRVETQGPLCGMDTWPASYRENRMVGGAGVLRRPTPRGQSTRPTLPHSPLAQIRHEGTAVPRTERCWAPS